MTHLDCHPSENFIACAHIDGVASVHRFCLDDDPTPNKEDGDDDDDADDKEASSAEKGHHGEEVFSYLDYEEACRVVKFNKGELHGMA